MRVAIFAVVLALISFAARADETRSLPPGGVSPNAGISDAGWVAGRWVGEGFGAVVEEVMSPPVGDAMIGHFYMAGKDGPAFYEIVLIREERGSLVYRVKHFHPDLKGWEEKDKTVDFPLVAVEREALYFDGLTIKRTGPDEVTHWVRVKGKDGKTEEAKLVYRRARM